MSQMNTNDDTLSMDILDVPNSTKYWFVRANTAAEYYTDFMTNHYIAIDSDNQNLYELLGIPSTIRSSTDALQSAYKTIFNNHDITQYKKENENSSKDPETIATELTKLRTKSTNRANRSYSFIEEMNIGDFIFVPYKSSTKFLVGIVTGDVFDDDIHHLYLGDDEADRYSICSYKFKRRVMWIKEVTQKYFPEKLSWIKSAHQSLFDITASGADVLNPIIAPIYRYKGKIYCRIGVNTTNQISNSTWLEYQQTMQNILQKNNNDVYQKSRVQSPGDIIQYAESLKWWLIPIIYEGLFGQFNYDIHGIKGTFIGPLRRFSPTGKKELAQEKEDRKSEKKDRELAQERENAKTAKLNAEADLKRAKAAKLNAETARIMHKMPNQEAINDSKFVKHAISDRVTRNYDRLSENNTEKIIKKNNIALPKTSTDEIQKKMQLSNENVGTSFEPENLLGNEKSKTDESEK